MRPAALNRDCSAMSKALPQRGQCGRLRFSVAKTGDRTRDELLGDCRDDATWYADWTIIVDPPRGKPHRNLVESDAARALWRHRDGSMKLSWRPGKTEGNPQTRPFSASALRSGRNWCGRTSGSLRACCWHRARAPRSSRRRKAEPRCQAQARVRALDFGSGFGGVRLPYAFGRETSGPANLDLMVSPVGLEPTTP